jgi:hypothetical protein
MIIIDRQVLSILSLIVAGSHAYVDTVIPATLREKDDSVSGNRAERLEKNVHLLAVLSLQQQVQCPSPFPIALSRAGNYTARIGIACSRST